MEGKDSFVFYISWFKYFDKLKSIEQREKLRILLRDYVTDKYQDVPIEEISCGDDVVDMAFIAIVDDLKQDLTKWKQTCENRSKAGKIGAEIKKQKQANQANANFAKNEKANQAKEADNEYDNEYEGDCDNEYDSNYLIDSPENQKTLSEKAIYKLIFDTWNEEKGLIKHHELTQVRQDAMKNALKKYNINDIIEAIKNYAMVLRSNYRWSYKWDLETFLKQSNAMPRFMAEGGVWNNFQQAVIDNPSILSPDDRPKQETPETPSCLKNFFNQIK